MIRTQVLKHLPEAREEGKKEIDVRGEAKEKSRYVRIRGRRSEEMPN